MTALSLGVISEPTVPLALPSFPVWTRGVWLGVTAEHWHTEVDIGCSIFGFFGNVSSHSLPLCLSVQAHRYLIPWTMPAVSLHMLLPCARLGSGLNLPLWSRHCSAAQNNAQHFAMKREKVNISTSKAPFWKKKNCMMHTLIFLTIYAWPELNSVFHTNGNAPYEHICTNSNKNRETRASTDFELLKYGLTRNNI